MRLSERLKNAFIWQEMEKYSITNGNVTEVLYSTKSGRKTIFRNETKSMYIYNEYMLEEIVPFDMIKDCMEVIRVLENDCETEKLTEQLKQKEIDDLKKRLELYEKYSSFEVKQIVYECLTEDTESKEKVGEDDEQIN